jgi:hypothetical protein
MTAYICVSTSLLLYLCSLRMIQQPQIFAFNFLSPWHNLVSLTHLTDGSDGLKWEAVWPWPLCVVLHFSRDPCLSKQRASVESSISRRSTVIGWSISDSPSLTVPISFLLAHSSCLNRHSPLSFCTTRYFPPLLKLGQNLVSARALMIFFKDICSTLWSNIYYISFTKVFWKQCCQLHVFLRVEICTHYSWHTVFYRDVFCFFGDHLDNDRVKWVHFIRELIHLMIAKEGWKVERKTKKCLW